MPPTINLTPHPLRRGRHISKPVLLIGGVLLMGLVVWILLPSGNQATSQRSWTQAREMSRMVKDSMVMQRMRGTYAGDAVNGEGPPQTPVVSVQADDADARLRDENARLAKENAHYRSLLNKVPAPPKPASPTAPVSDGSARQREQERKQREQADRKLIVRQASPSKDGARNLLAVKHPPTPYTLASGWKVPCITEGPVSNEVPGSFSVRVRTPVWNSATGQHVVIPPAASIVAAPRGSAVLYGDGRLGISLQTLAFPDASEVKFTKATAGDREGHVGFSDQIDRRTLSLLASIVLYPLLRSGSSLIPSGSYGDPASTLGRNIASETSRQGEQVTRQYLRTEPILLMRPGYECLITLEESMPLTRSWPLE